MTDSLIDQLKASTLKSVARSPRSSLTDGGSDGATPEDWKKNLKLPAKDMRQQTEVGIRCQYLSNTYC